MTTGRIARPWGDQAFRRARSIGARAPMLMLRHILPGTLPSVIVYCSLRVGTSILTAAALSFMGWARRRRAPNGGRCWRRAELSGVADQIMLFPGLAIFVTVLAFNLLGMDCATRWISSCGGFHDASQAPKRRSLFGTQTLRFPSGSS